MFTRESDPHQYDPQQSYAAKQLSRYDMQVAGVVVYVVTMTMFFVVALVMMLFRNEPAAEAHIHTAKPAITSTAVPPSNQSARADSKQSTPYQ